mmetsp:Transcript_112679/g.297582  ORF Transcript_112679/g.297582 Transcript_112679/m.297582 type:complete len:251 (-) Transcript_112679:976-1728(-)
MRVDMAFRVLETSGPSMVVNADAVRALLAFASSPSEDPSDLKRLDTLRLETVLVCLSRAGRKSRSTPGSGSSSSSALDSPALLMPWRQSVGPTSWLMTTQPVMIAAVPFAHSCSPMRPICICATSPSVTPDWLCSVIQTCRFTRSSCRVKADAEKLPRASAAKRSRKSSGTAAACSMMAPSSREAPATVKKGGMTTGASPLSTSRSCCRRSVLWIKKLALIMQTSSGSTRRSCRSGDIIGITVFSFSMAW